VWRQAEVVATNLLGDRDVGAFVLNIRDITERKELEEQLTHLAFHDPLTDLANRALFRDRLKHALVRSRRHGKEVAVLFLDLDDFKTVNDTLGHGSGDELLVAVAKRLSGCLRPSDTVARPGGDEFAILLEDLDDQVEPVRAAERLLKVFGKPFEVGDQTVFVRASVGIATTPSAGETAEEIVRNADIAMYTAKAQGKGMYELFESGMHGAVVERMQLENDLRQALEREELHLEYQPIVSLRTWRLTGVEALLRWRHPERGLVPPMEFIPVAERSGMILPLGRWVLETAARQTRRWQERHRSSPPLELSVNLSARQLREPGFTAEVAEAVRESGLHPSTLVLEITESVLIDDADEVSARLDELRTMGAKIAIDDFGTGYSALSYLRRFKLDALKIDRAFVADLTPGSQASALASAIVAMGHNLGLRTVAEGIETAEQLAELRAMGCDLAQGYYFARPVPADELERMLGAGLTLGLAQRPRPPLPVE
jgi:diguanylate cyclase (GGDEF)-like protein